MSSKLPEYSCVDTYITGANNGRWNRKAKSEGMRMKEREKEKKIPPFWFHFPLIL